MPGSRPTISRSTVPMARCSSEKDSCATGVNPRCLSPSWIIRCRRYRHLSRFATAHGDGRLIPEFRGSGDISTCSTIRRGNNFAVNIEGIMGSPVIGGPATTQPPILNLQCFRSVEPNRPLSRTSGQNRCFGTPTSSLH